MTRLHLFEIEDQKWCPSIIRKSITDYLLGLYNLLHIFEPAYKKIEEVLNNTGVNAIVDCCSGSGGPSVQLRDYLDSRQMQSISITLTDKYPNIERFQYLEKCYGDRLVGLNESIDASKLPSSLKGLRCFFSSFHHFAPAQALNILQDAVNNKAPIAIFESTQRSLSDFIRAFFSPVLMLFIMPFAKTLNLSKFFITYIIPIIPFVFMWDYFVSNIRTYSSKELQLLINKLDAPGYKWEIGKLWSKKAKIYIPYLIGYSINS